MKFGIQKCRELFQIYFNCLKFNKKATIFVEE